jgi:hypothetical protein
MIPKGSPVSWEELTGKRTTTVHKRNSETEIINDDWKTADPPDKAFDYSWTGTTVFERKLKPTHRMTTKKPPTVPKPTVTSSTTSKSAQVELPAHQRNRSPSELVRTAAAAATDQAEEMFPDTEHFQPAHQLNRSPTELQKTATAAETVEAEEIFPETERFQPATDQRVPVDKLPEDTYSPDELALQA